MLKKIEKNIFIIIALMASFAIIFANNMNKYPSNLDELWNFNTARCIANGLTPYTQISMITTTLFPTIISIALRIFGSELIVFRACNALMGVGILLMAYLIFKHLIKNENISAILILILTYIYYPNFTLDYNYFVLLLFLIIEFIQLKRTEKLDNKKQIYFTIGIGVLAGCAICTKHTLGLVISAFIVISEIFISNRKDIIKNIIYKIVGICIPVLIFLLIRIMTNSLGEFIDYSILGIRTFTNSISYTKLLENGNWFIEKGAIAIPIVIGITLIANIVLKIRKSNKYSENMMITSLASIPMFITIYPIADKNHFLIAILPALICLLYVIVSALKIVYSKIRFKIKKYILLAIEYFIFFLIIVKMIQASYFFWNEYTEKLNQNIELQSELSHLTAIPQREEYTKKVVAFKNFINEKKQEGYNVYICDAEACAYDIPIDIYNKNYDMFLKGNIGKDGENGIIEQIKNSPKSIYIIKNKNQTLNWQTPTAVIDYIRNNLSEGEKILNFVAYYNINI